MTFDLENDVENECVTNADTQTAHVTYMVF